MKYRTNLFQPSVSFHIETSHLFYSANQMTVFHMERNTGLKWVNNFLGNEIHIWNHMEKAKLLIDVITYKRNQNIFLNVCLGCQGWRNR